MMVPPFKGRRPTPDTALNLSMETCNILFYFTVLVVSITTVMAIPAYVDTLAIVTATIRKSFYKIRTKDSDDQHEVNT